MMDERLAGDCAAAWTLLSGAAGQPARARPDPRRLARGLLHAAEEGLCRSPTRASEAEAPEGIRAARLFCLLQMALRSGGYDPVAPGESPVWEALLQRVPAAWATALEAADAARPPRGAARGRREAAAEEGEETAAGTSWPGSARVVPFPVGG